MKPNPTSTDPAKDDARRLAIAALAPERRAVLLRRLRKDAVDGHALVARSLKALGVERVYSLAGTPMGETLAACIQSGVRVLGVRHQQAAVLMAAADNYIAGRLVAAPIVSPGPGLTNAATGILVAYDNCWPLVVLGGRRPLNMRGKGSFQELAGVPIYESITKWSAVVETPERIPASIRTAVHTAASGRPGPVYLELPEDVLTGVGSMPESFHGEKPAPPPIDGRAVDRAAGILLNAERPGLIIGKGVRWSEPYDELRSLVENFGIPFISSPMGRGFLSDEHPLCFNDAHHLLQSRADAVLVVGARLDWTFRFGTELHPDAKVIHVDIHVPEAGRNVTSAVGLVGDAKEALQELVGRMGLRDGGESRDRLLAAWHSVLEEERRRKRRELEPLVSSDKVPMSPHRMMREIRDVLPPDAICVLDGNVSMAAAQQAIPGRAPASRLTAGSNGCMGVGIPFALGARLAAPDRLVVAICGDAAFGFSGMEMETAVRYGVPIIVIVANNDGISGALTQRALFPPDHEPVAMFQPAIRYDEIMRTFGGHSEFVEIPGQLKPALERAIASGKPACVNVLLDPCAPYPGG